MKFVRKMLFAFLFGAMLIPAGFAAEKKKETLPTEVQCPECKKQVKVPKEMEPYIERFDFILGVQAASPYNCGMLSYGDTVYVNFIRKIQEPELERYFFAVLQEQGLSATVESNQNGR